MASLRDKGSEVAAFGEATRDADMARVAHDRERLNFERECLERESAAREEDEAQHRKDMEEPSRVEMDKLKLMLEMVCSRKYVSR